MVIEYREHDSQRFRVWSEQDAAYGCFHLVTLDQLKMIIRANRLMGVVVRPADFGVEVDMRGYRPQDGLAPHVLELELRGSS